MDCHFTHTNHEVVWVKSQAQPCYDDKTMFNGYVGTLTDITELKSVQESLQMAGVVFDNTREAILVTDNNVNIVTVNKAFTDIEGYSALEMLGKNPSILNSGKHNNDYFTVMYSALKETGCFKVKFGIVVRMVKFILVF